jgi:hypothetical protein
MITILSTVISILAFQFRRRTLGVGVTKACDPSEGRTLHTVIILSGRVPVLQPTVSL